MLISPQHLLELRAYASIRDAVAAATGEMDEIDALVANITEMPSEEVDLTDLDGADADVTAVTPWPELEPPTEIMPRWKLERLREITRGRNYR
jgi:hypothetical protein